jgi:tripartite-type tricarboxylate transporter receptor subunit TctC
MTAAARAFALLLLVFLSCGAGTARAQAEDGYPARAVRFIVPYAPGGNGDIVSRIIGQRLSKTFGQQFVIDNRAGAGGNIGAEAAARAAPDGYTIVLGTNTHAINMSLYARPGYDLAADFAPVTLLTTAPMLLAVHPSLPAKSVKEFIALARSRPGKLNYGTGGSGSSAHIITELLKTTAGIDLVHVPYKGTAQAATDLIAGQIQVMFIATSSALNFMRSGKLVGLGVSTAKPSALAPGIPPLAQSGLPGFDASIWQGILAPARTPPRIVTLLNREISGQLDQKEVRDQFLAQGAEAMSSTPERFGAFIKSEIERWGKVVKASGAKVD